MADSCIIFILSDVHYAGPAETERGWREADFIQNPLLRSGVKAYRRFIWRRDPFAHNYLLDRFLHEVRSADFVLANGDYSCDTAFVGVSDDAAYQSAAECLRKLRSRFGARLHQTIGDHELGKMSLFGDEGGMRLESWRRTREGLGLLPFWKLEVGKYVILGVTSSLLALPVYESDTLPEERSEWRRLRENQLLELRAEFARLEPEQRVIFLCHDPTALPFLAREPIVRAKLNQITATIIGHLHSRLFLWKSRLLSGMPTIEFLGTSIRRMSAALNEARYWQLFNVRLCPALAGIQLLKDGGYYRLELDPQASEAPRFQLQKLRWQDS